MRKITILCLLLLFWNLSAAAQEKFEGFYGGVAIGYSDSKDHGKEIEFFGPSSVKQDNELSGSSVVIDFGYNKVIDNSFVAGLTASYEKNNVSDRVYQYDSADSSIDTSCCTVKSKLKDSIYLGVKLGKIFFEDNLVYLSAGRAFKHLERNFDDTTISESHRDSVWQNGWYYGVGAEKYFSDKLSLVLDYKRIDLAERTYYGFQSWGLEKHDYKENNFKIGINYHF